MSNDLISRSALIDELKQSGMIVDNDYGNAMVDFINSQPTAYDVENVMGQLEKERNIQYRKDGSMLSSRSNISIDKAIEIIKAGGVSDNN